MKKGKILEMIKQSTTSQKAEIEFRKKLHLHQSKGKKLFNDEFDSEGIKTILKKRMNETIKQMNFLKNKIKISPYIELGAERGQRSLVMENNCGASGAALDLSYDMLKSCEDYAQEFGNKKIPLRICCDANTLPFKSNSVPFVFCYQTLHHFPDPKPIIEEAYRVIAPGGSFFFDEEPYKKLLHINLYKSERIYSKKSLNAGNLKKIFDYFFAEKPSNELEWGVTENEDISLRTWKKSISMFNKKDIKLKSMRYINSKLYGFRNPITFAMAYLFGGSISGLVNKQGKSIQSQKNKDIIELIICPECRGKGAESNLTITKSHFNCSCGKKFPIVNGVVFLFTEEKLKELYHEYVNL